MLECDFAIDTAVATDGTDCLGESTRHGGVYIVPGMLSVFKTMKVVRYYTQVDPDVAYDPKQFATEVDVYLADPDGWSQFFRFRAMRGPHSKCIRLSSPSTLKTNGCKDGELSCAVLGGHEIWLNSERWIKGAPASKLPLDEYRQYMVSHEMGHSLGHDHVECPKSGPAPVMMQQTLGIGSCSPNTKVLVRHLQNHNASHD